MASAAQRLVLLASLLSLAVAWRDAGVSRSLLQRATGPEVLAISFLYRPLTDGGLELVSNYTALNGPRGAYLEAVDPSAPGLTYEFEYGTYTTASRVWTNVGCLELSLETRSTQVYSFLTTFSLYQSLFSDPANDAFESATPIGDSNLTSSNPGPVTIATDPDEEYVFVVYSLASRNATLTYDVIGHPEGSSACGDSGSRRSGSSPRGAPPPPSSSRRRAPPPGSDSASPAAAPSSITRGRRLLQTTGSYPTVSRGTSNSQTQTARVAQIYRNFDDRMFANPFVVQNASCLAYKILGYTPTFANRATIDVITFVLNETSFLEWADNSDGNFDPTDPDVVRSRYALCAQNNTNPDSCGLYVDDLDPQEAYWITIVTGSQLFDTTETVDPVTVQIVFTAQTTGSCASNSLQSWNTTIDNFTPSSAGSRATPPPPSSGRGGRGGRSSAASPEAASPEAASPDNLFPLPGRK